MWRTGKNNCELDANHTGCQGEASGPYSAVLTVELENHTTGSSEGAQALSWPHEAAGLVLPQLLRNMGHGNPRGERGERGESGLMVGALRSHLMVSEPGMLSFKA